MRSIPPFLSHNQVGEFSWFDFDLEAPGLTTFDHLLPPSPRAGVVEFVSDYLDSEKVPEIEDYVFEAPPADGLKPQQDVGYACGPGGSRLQKVSREDQLG